MAAIFGMSNDLLKENDMSFTRQLKWICELPI